MSEFPCTQCGCCCKRAKQVLDQGSILFPYGYKEDGSCEMLIDNKCSVYENRPDICNISVMAKRSGLPLTDHKEANIKACNDMMDEDNINIKYRIK